VYTDMTSGGKAFRKCFEKSGVEIPKDYHVGLTAASDEFSDDHDVFALEVYQVDPPSREAKRQAKKLSEEQKRVS
jgi:hypothetical protein